MGKKPSAVKFSVAYKNNLPLFSHTPPYSFLFVLQQIIKTEYSKISTPSNIKYRKRLRLHPKNRFKQKFTLFPMKVPVQTASCRLKTD